MGHPSGIGIMKKKLQKYVQNEATSRVAYIKFFKEQTNYGNRWTNQRLTKFINFSNKLTELLADAICVVLEEGELTRSVSQRTVTVILMEGEKFGIKKIGN